MLYNDNSPTDNLTDLYSDNENGYGGYFPLGINNIWHSGIHINSKKEIFPFRPGELVAYNICEEYVKTCWPKYLTGENFGKLSDSNKELFNKTGYGGYRLNKETSSEKCSNSFILLKHNVSLSADDGNKNKFSFFTLYMNLMPVKDNLIIGSFYNKYGEAPAALPKEPFYTEWQLKLVNTTGLHTIYKYNKETNIFEGSRFKIVRKTFKYSDYKNIKETPSTNNPMLPAKEITFSAPESSCSEDIPLSDVKLEKEVIIIPKETNLELYRENHLGGKIADLQFKSEHYFELKSQTERSAMTEGSDTPGENAERYLKLQFPIINGNIELACNITCYIKVADIEAKAYKEEGNFYEYQSTDYENTRPFKDTTGTSLFAAYNQDLFKIQDKNDKIKINGFECYKATFEITGIFEIKVTDRIAVAMEGVIQRTTANEGNFIEEKNCLVYYTDSTKTNPAGIKTNEVEFTPQNSDDFRSTNSAPVGYIRFDTDQYYYVDLSADRKLQARLIMKNGFKTNENTKVPEQARMNITSGDLLGYPALCEETNKSYFDFVVFSTEDLSSLGESEASFYKKNFIKYEEDSNEDDLFVEPKNFWDFFNEKNIIPKIDRNKFLCFGKNGIIDEKELLDFFTSQDDAIKNCRKDFYKLICLHPFEWDAKFTQKTIKKDYESVFGKKLKGEFAEAWSKNLSDKLVKLSVFEGGFKSATASKNLFNFMHPLYFLEKLHEDEGLPESMEENRKHLPKEALDLIEVQDKVLSLECLKKGNTGIFFNEMTPGQTYCNHAVFLTIMGVDKNFNRFTNRVKDVFPEVNSLNSIFNKAIETKHKNEDFYFHRVSNYWCDILAEASRNESTGIKEVNLEEAQKLANQGYVVIVCYKNLAFRYGSPHFATIRPNYNTKTYTIDSVEVANVGIKNKVLKISDNDSFGTGDISLYYNKLQQFEKNLDVIKHF